MVLFTDLISGETYVISVATVNELTGVVPDEQFGTTAVIMRVTVPEGSSDSTTPGGSPDSIAPRGSPDSTAIAIGVSVVVHFAFVLIVIATTVIFLLVLR